MAVVDGANYLWLHVSASQQHNVHGGREVQDEDLILGQVLRGLLRHTSCGCEPSSAIVRVANKDIGIRDAVQGGLRGGKRINYWSERTVDLYETCPRAVRGVVVGSCDDAIFVYFGKDGIRGTWVIDHSEFSVRPDESVSNVGSVSISPSDDIFIVDGARERGRGVWVVDSGVLFIEIGESTRDAVVVLVDTDNNARLVDTACRRHDRASWIRQADENTFDVFKAIIRSTDSGRGIGAYDVSVIVNSKAASHRGPRIKDRRDDTVLQDVGSLGTGVRIIGSYDCAFVVDAVDGCEIGSDLYFVKGAGTRLCAGV